MDGFKGKFGERKSVIETALTIGAAIGTLGGVAIGWFVGKKNVATEEPEEAIEETESVEEVEAELETEEEETK